MLQNLSKEGSFSFLSLFLSHWIIAVFLHCRDEAKVLKEMEKELEAKLFEKVQQQLLQSKNEMKQELLLKVKD